MAELTDETRYRLLRCIDERPGASQRELARHLGISLGKVNYCLRALMQKGLLKAGNFRRNSNKLSYAYVLTPKGIQEKANVTYRFLKRKLEEYAELSAEIEKLRREVSQETVGDADVLGAQPRSKRT
jgi:EPS-associated MarR family transcriptional regulator